MLKEKFFFDLHYLENKHYELSNILEESIHKDYMPLKISMRADGYIEKSLSNKIQDNKLGKIINNCLYIGDSLSKERLNLLMNDIAILIKNTVQIKWHDELIDLLHKEESIGFIERSTARFLGLKTRSVHLNAWESNYSIWVSKRSMNKYINPGKWDTLVGGLVSYQESIEEALIRESFEEAGIDLLNIIDQFNIKKIKNIKKLTKEGYQIEDLFSLCCSLEQKHPINHDGEVEIINKMNINKIISKIQKGEFTEEAAFIIITDTLNIIKKDLNLHQV
ncbi:NUDIX hydrolase [Candidatus Kinetoplastibacterium desouzaii TCC079E]|uniref:NUDIX hydrolase n=1 Tax=Candidatus Kinetoplastidibacterium desouzai TCC079E TaxID=1208919 RepID=M1LLG2_9PROT|nr:NUDIX domain-containing protein [Candidatus Kinetoplastibacterium desouzaii]AGF46597.1 NUDIX hydrolase [Candidatus Kinetoplastibacterium desouzaii TCC079E]